MNTKHLRLIIAAASIVLLHSARVYAQADNEWVGAGVSTNGWNVGANWSTGFPPDPNFDDNAKLGADTGVGGVPNTIEVTLTTDLSSTPSPRVSLGDASGFQGTLNLQTGANFVTTTGTQATSANFDVGINGGTGFLNVSGTAQLTVGGQLTTSPSGNAASTIALQDSATVNAGSLFNEHIMRIIGSDVTFTVAGNAVLGGPGTHEWEFGPTGPSVLFVAGQLSLDGALKIDTLGETPGVGDSWVIADSQSVIQGFTSVDTSDVPNFGNLGQGVAIRAVSAPDVGSTNGVVTRIVVEQQPVLIVNRRSGEVEIRNPSTLNATVAYDAYIVGSADASLSTGNWTSLSPSDGWQEANPTASAISELNPLSSQSLAANTTLALGAIFQPAEKLFGEDTDDVSFEFAPDGEEFVNGQVVYEGIPTDTLTLNVDRTTGDAQILNGFREEVSIDSYVVTSDSGSLDATGFLSIGGDWQVAINETGTISELNPLTSLDLASSAGQLLGNIFDFDGASMREDLVFQFTLPGEDFFRTGKVYFDDELTLLQQTLLGDADNDLAVAGSDLLAVTNNFGSTGAPDGLLLGDADDDGAVAGSDLLAVTNNFGKTLAGSLTSAPIPEPNAALLLGLGIMATAAVRRVLF